MSDYIALFLQSMGEREMADEVTRMHNRLEAFASGLDRDAFDDRIGSSHDPLCSNKG